MAILDDLGILKACTQQCMLGAEFPYRPLECCLLVCDLGASCTVALLQLIPVCRQGHWGPLRLLANTACCCCCSCLCPTVVVVRARGLCRVVPDGLVVC